MKIKELIYQAPEMTEEKLLKIMDSHLDWLSKSFKKRITEIHGFTELSKSLLDEYDIIQDKKSFLTRSECNTVIGFVGTCMIEMTKGNDDGTIGK